MVSALQLEFQCLAPRVIRDTEKRDVLGLDLVTEVVTQKLDVDTVGRLSHQKVLAETREGILELILRNSFRLHVAVA
jgi:hypothetical protein